MSKDNCRYVSAMKNGFLVVPFKLPSQRTLEAFDKKNHENGTVCHYIYVKKHQSHEEHEKSSLFVVNLPLLANVDSCKKALNEICSQYDTVAHVEDLLYNDEFGLGEVDLSALTSDLLTTGNKIEKRFTPRNTAILKFVDDSSVNNCLNALKRYSMKCVKDQNKSAFEWSYTKPSVSTFLNFYKPLDIEYLKDEIHTHMTLFEQREQEAQDDVQSSLVDEDGFTLVVGKNTKSLNSIRKKILNKNPLLKHGDISKDGYEVTKPGVLDKKAKHDFYRFQIRERKKHEINELLGKFKEDQERIKVMKAKKRFNPYT